MAPVLWLACVLSIAVTANDVPPLKQAAQGEDVLHAGHWEQWEQGYSQEGEVILLRNDAPGQCRGALQTVTLNQQRPEPIIASALSRAEDISGERDNDYSVYLDIVYTDGSPLWGQCARFNTGTHDWQRAEVVVMPEKPIQSVRFYLILRNRTGTAWFKEPRLQIAPDAALFEGVPVTQRGEPREGFQVRDVAAGRDFHELETNALGLGLDQRVEERDGATFITATLTASPPADRALTLLYSIPVHGEAIRWLGDALSAPLVEARQEYSNANLFWIAGHRGLSRYPVNGVASGSRGVALAVDPDYPAFYRIVYNAGTGELYLAYDIGLSPERPTATLRFCKFEFDAAWDFRAALARYYALFPAAFQVRAKRHGIWMPFAPISKVEGWQDFGFMFKEGNDETAWDDAQGILTFRYTEPMTWWMPMPKEVPRTIEAAAAEAQRLAEEGNPAAKAFAASVFHDASGRFVAEMHDTPWCNGAVWSMNSSPAVCGEATDFKLKWNPELRKSLYGEGGAGTLDGEYIDSSEGYVTKELDFRREHFATAQAPLTFERDTCRPAVFRGLIAYEYARALAEDVHGDGKLMMANATPDRLFWLAPLLDVMGTEMNWNPGGKWTPAPPEWMLYRRAMCKGKPYCFLMNSVFDEMPRETVEKFMKRCVAYGMFPGFFSHNAAEGHYFSRPDLYNRDRELFKKYVPLCRLLSEAGWEPITRARTAVPRMLVERFGERYLTVFNDGGKTQQADIVFESPVSTRLTRLTPGGECPVTNGHATVELGAEEVAVFEMAF